MVERKFTSKKEIVILFVLLTAVLAGWFLYYKSQLTPEGTPLIVQIKERGTIIYRSSLGENNMHLMHHNPNVVIEIKDGAARFVASDCLDQICVKQGWRRKAGQSAACLPNQVILEILSDTGNGGGVDIMV